MVGTVAYMAPEQALGREVTPRADLYSLGCVLYEMTSGRPPFVGDDAVALISQHINTPPVAPRWHNPRVGEGLERVILSLLSKEPDQRPESAAQLIDLLSGDPSTSTPVDESSAAPRFSTVPSASG